VPLVRGAAHSVPRQFTLRSPFGRAHYDFAVQGDVASGQGALRFAQGAAGEHRSLLGVGVLTAAAAACSTAHRSSSVRSTTPWHLPALRNRTQATVGSEHRRGRERHIDPGGVAYRRMEAKGLTPIADVEVVVTTVNGVYRAEATITAAKA
jgi:hypothetical protein